MALAVYRQNNVSAVANKTAQSIGSIYGSKYKEPDMAYQNINDFKNLNLYRYVGTKKLNEENIKKAVWYAGYSLKETELSSEEPDYNNEIQASIDTNAIGNRVITVTITRKYKDFFLTPVSWLGIDSSYTCSASGTAQCYDIIEYINEESFEKELYNKAASSSDATSTINTVLNCVQTVLDIINKIKSALKDGT
jgi:hypothetical protein